MTMSRLSVASPGRVEQIAEEFHREYETQAPLFGYRTREESAVPWRDVPDANKALMRATIRRLLERGVESCVAERALQAVEPDPLPRCLHGEAMAKAVRVDALAHPCTLAQVLQLAPNVGCGHRSARCVAADDRDQRAGRDLLADAQPVEDLPPRPLVHEQDTALVALPVSDRDGALLHAEVALVEVERFRDADTGAVEDHEQAPEPLRAQLVLAPSTERDARGEELGEVLGAQRLGRKLAAAVGVVRLAPGRRPVRGHDAKVGLGRHGANASCSARGQSRWRGAVPTFLGSLKSSDPPSSGADPGGRAGHRHAERARAAAPVGGGSPGPIRVGQTPRANPRTHLPLWGRSGA